jgi:hypothetical protein
MYICLSINVKLWLTENLPSRGGGLPASRSGLFTHKGIMINIHWHNTVWTEGFLCTCWQTWWFFYWCYLYTWVWEVLPTFRKCMFPSSGPPFGRVSVHARMELGPIDTREEGWGEWYSIRAASDRGQRRVMKNCSHFSYSFHTCISGCSPFTQQWPLARTVGSFVRLPLEAWMSFSVYSVFVSGSGLTTG